MQDLKIKLFINPKCELVSVDDTTYYNLHYSESTIEDLTNHVSLEFLVDYSDEVLTDSIKFSEHENARKEFLSGNISVFKLKNDGVFMYYKYLIPKLNHLLKTEDSVPVYKTANQLYYDDGNIYHAKNDHSTLEDLKENSTRIVDLTDL